MPFSKAKFPFRKRQATAQVTAVDHEKPGKITPYLDLTARLSQTWINKWTVLLLLVLARMILAIVGLNDDIASARREALSACTSVENVGSAMASMPHYLSQGVNELTAAGVEHAVNGLMHMLTLTVTGVEELVVFYINMLTSTYVCLITLVVSGSLHAALALIEDVTGFLNKTLDSIGNDISNDISSFQHDLNSMIDGVDHALKDLGLGVSIPELNVTGSLAELYNLQIPSSFNADLQQLNSSIPTFAEVRNLTQTAIRWPFEEIKTLIGERSGNYTVNRSVFPVPNKEALTFCSDNNGIDNFFDDLVETAIIARKVAIAILLILAVAACIPMAYREIRGWRIQKQRAELISAGRYDNMDVVYIVSHPYTASAGIKIADSVSSSTRRQTLIRWTVAYATTVPALFVLALGIAGLFSCFCQFLLLKAVERQIPSLEAEISGFSNQVVWALNNASEHWQNGTNSAILDTQQRLNDDLFGWVNISTHALNNTLNVFVDESIKILNLTFGGTVLYDPVTELFNCLIGLKVASIEAGLTWVSDNAYIDFPVLPNNTFSLGATSSMNNDSLLATPQSGATDSITAAVTRVDQKLHNAILYETIISSVIVGVWLIIVLIGFIRALMLWIGSNHDNDDGNDKPFYAGGTIRENPFADAKTIKTSNNSDPLRDTDSGYAGRPSDELPQETNSYRGNATVFKPVPYAASNATLPPYSSPQRQPKPKYEGPIAENYGFAGARGVGSAIKRPNHFRASSHGDMIKMQPVGPGMGVAL